MLDWGFSLLGQRIMLQLAQAILTDFRKEENLMKYDFWYSYVFAALWGHSVLVSNLRIFEALELVKGFSDLAESVFIFWEVWKES